MATRQPGTKSRGDQEHDRTRRARQLREGSHDLEHQVSRPRPPQGLEDLEHPIQMLGGGLLAYAGLKQLDTWTGLGLVGAGAGLVYRTLSDNGLLGGQELKRRILQTGTSETTRVRTAITIDRPVQAVFATWRELGNLELSMRHIESSREIGEDRWQFTARVPGTSMTVNWVAELVEEVENERLVWRSTDDSDLHTEGRIEFVPRRDNENTEVYADIAYHPPAGKMGKSIAGFLRGLTRQVVKEDLRRFKQYMETGVVATIEGQSSGRRQPDQRTPQNYERHTVH
jgi:uncharacterized membrane protein